MTAIQYSRFCELYRKLGGAAVGDDATIASGGRGKLSVDYAGDVVLVIVDWLTGEGRGAQIFVAVLGASNFLHAEAS